MTMHRLNYVKAAPEAYRLLARLTEHLAKSSLDLKLIQLVYLRVSQINGCSYCVILHVRELRALGETMDRLDALLTWREAPFYASRERAALGWAEVLTRIADTGAPDDDYEKVRKNFSEREMVELTFAIGLMNAWNRIAIGFRHNPDQSTASTSIM